MGFTIRNLHRNIEIFILKKSFGMSNKQYSLYRLQSNRKESINEKIELLMAYSFWSTTFSW